METEEGDPDDQNVAKNSDDQYFKDGYSDDFEEPNEATVIKDPSNNLN